MMPHAGIEPATFCLLDRRSAPEPMRRITRTRCEELLVKKIDGRSSAPGMRRVKDRFAQTTLMEKVKKFLKEVDVTTATPLNDAVPILWAAVPGTQLYGLRSLSLLGA
uniref:Uncharacterized protein n=1 Tax=Steinernema glaseri TaxID=37863 RepID=A0A1I7ZQY7_9BILA